MDKEILFAEESQKPKKKQKCNTINKNVEKNLPDHNLPVECIEFSL